MSLETAIRYFYRPDLDPFAEKLNTLKDKTPINSLETLLRICEEINKGTNLGKEEKDFINENIVFVYIKLNAMTLTILDVKNVIKAYPNASFIGDLLDVFILHQNNRGIAAWYKCKNQKPKLTKKELLRLAHNQQIVITHYGPTPIDIKKMENTISFLWPGLE